jgi:hypothetical protein
MPAAEPKAFQGESPKRLKMKPLLMPISRNNTAPSTNRR